ncbi:MAG: hemolysin III family protein [Anaerolineales bacterium]|nr:hemolysin III family protein [Anaerolineales bacterium]MCB9126459.1 hemolysin III family protein [Ardenticatenales bacterium]MCB9171619.1 hemolysin III family protein [Ardenticatenales bacterium]
MFQYFREPISGLTHLAGAIFGFVGLLWLVYLTRDDPAKMTSMIVYGMSIVLLYSASAALHLVKGSARLILWLNRFDHAAIYLLIAGTYTPICVNLLTGNWRLGMLGTIWALAVLGVIYKLIFFKRPNHLSTLLYLGMGWMAIIAFPELLPRMPAGALWLTVAGGALYSGGALIYAVKRPNFHPEFGSHEIWHLFCLAGSALHYAAIAFYVA